MKRINSTDKNTIDLFDREDGEIVLVYKDFDGSFQEWDPASLEECGVPLCTTGPGSDTWGMEFVGVGRIVGDVN